MAKIQVFFGGSLQSEFPLESQEEYAVGRAPDCDIVIDNLAVSRRHCLFKSLHGQWMIEDNQSANGTFLNGQRTYTQALKHQDRIVIGKHTLLFDDYGSGHTHQSVAANVDKPAEPQDEGDATCFVRRDMVAQYVQRSEKGNMVLVLEGVRRKVVPLDKELTVVGRGSRCDLRIDGWFVKGEQLSIVKQQYGYRVVHEGGWRPLRVNGNKVREAILQAGDVLTIAGHRISFGSL
ncbi:FHA domain-containing protein [Methylomagnum ishizawai]|uniref:FHA domain-containing protein n=1 Tax=Methylomagnum ishizawai TaxID=1760988 RepID=A0A1Y6D0S2_9GAMM|nr:FHA domain-containing protein [Methylomagnum ishizawai]SMF96247.1 FHA domain-containing protein [Methylomagnum ishizawai]